MGRKDPKRGLLALALLVVAACGGRLAPTAGDAGDDGGDASAVDPQRWSFNPTKYSSTCNVDSDCVLRPVITGCLVCCTNRGAIRGNISELDYRSVVQACAEPGAPTPRGACSADCNPGIVTCRQNDCAVVRTPPLADGGR